MTIEKLLGMSADQLDKISKAELEVYFAPYLKITRPEMAVPKKVAMAQKTNAVMSKLSKVNPSLAKELGDIFKL